MSKVRTAVAAMLALLAANLAGTAGATVPGSKLTVTFEGLARGHHEWTISEYDGLKWAGPIWAAAKGAFRDDPGFQSVIHGKVAGVIQDFNGSGFITPVSGLMSIKSGHFASFGGHGMTVTFNAYRNDILVGTMPFDLPTSDTVITFDSTFSDIDRFEIVGQVAFDNLVVKF
jgi:hypothetical protein